MQLGQVFILYGIIKQLPAQPALRVQKVDSMFDSLDEQMKHDRDRESTPRERLMMWAAVVVISTAAFVGLIWSVQRLNGS